MIDKNRGAFVLVIKNEDILLVQYPKNARVYPSTWSLPGGYVEIDEDTAAGAEREVFEETGIKCKARRMVLKKDFLHFFVGEYISGQIQIDPKEVQDAKWVPHSDLHNYNLGFDYAEIILRLLEEVDEMRISQ